MAKVLDLRGMIYSKFDNEAQAADAMGWSRQRLNKITSGSKEPDLFDVKALADVLGVTFMDVAQIFLQSESTDVDNRKTAEVGDNNDMG